MKPRYGHFNWIAPIYDGVFGRAHHDALLAHLSAESGQWVLDIGGGTGRVAGALADLGARVVVVDPSPPMLARARGRGLPAARALAEGLPFADDSVDRAFVVDAFHHFADQPMAARELVRVLRPGGRLVIEEPDIRRMSVKGIAVAERLALMQSRFRSPRDLQLLFAAAGARPLSVTPHEISVHLVFTK
jgi:demethylmenaquinone methyltransferase/2-methoxy-6-polyprenyl-1,4-benzoquinol methylase